MRLILRTIIILIHFLLKKALSAIDGSLNHIPGGKYSNDRDGIVQPLLDLAKISCSWIAFVTFVQYFPELMHNEHNLVSGNFLTFTPNQHMDADTPHNNSAYNI